MGDVSYERPWKLGEAELEFARFDEEECNVRRFKSTLKLEPRLNGGKGDELVRLLTSWLMADSYPVSKRTALERGVVGPPDRS